MERLRCLLCAALLVSLCGCGLTHSMRPVTRYAKNLFTFRGTDYSNPTEEEDEQWIIDAGEEARAGRPREMDPDGWWQKYMTSEKARGIERNVGIDSNF